MKKFRGPGDRVPFISQIDEVDDPQWQEKFCGIVAVYMVLAYWWSQKAIPHHPDLDAVSTYGLKIGGYGGKQGWIHSKLADVARHYKHPAVVRSWFMRDSDLMIMRNQNRLATSEEMDSYTNQVMREFVMTLEQHLSEGIPMILSVKPQFGMNGDNHLVVMTGISEDGSEVTVHDPQTHSEDANQVVSMKRLLEFSNFNAIFIYP